MKNNYKKTFNTMAITATTIVVALVFGSNFFSNSIFLLMERINFIPVESSIFFFDPYVINEGSGDYWLYGKDRKYYYYFSYEKKTPYIFIPISNNCPHFDKSDFKTWCSAQQGKTN